MPHLVDKTPAELGIIAPCIHTGGTSRTALAAGYRRAAGALDDALTLLAETCPNGRDYYTHPLGPDAMARAVREHEAREARLLAVYAELAALWSEVDP